jgi:hypothetical protein
VPTDEIDPVKPATGATPDKATPLGNDKPPKSPRGDKRLSNSALMITSFSVLVATTIAFSALFYANIFQVTPTTKDNRPPPGTASSVEWQFHNEIEQNTPAGHLLDEWHAARSAHKVIAYAIARCLNIDTANMNDVAFDSLMLDLKPNGDHFWQGASLPPSDGRQPSSGLNEHLQFTSYEAAMLALSDGISRARLAAVAGADEFYPSMFKFGWAAVVVSALATMVVTLKSSLGKDTAWILSFSVGFFAIFLSTVATMLTGAKQFFDPTNAYMRNETAVLAFRQLHEEVSLTFASGWQEANCAPGTKAFDDQRTKFPRWRSTLVSLQSGTMPAPVIVAAPSNTAGQNTPSDDIPDIRSNGAVKASEQALNPDSQLPPKGN